jgi:hypothetical protein
MGQGHDWMTFTVRFLFGRMLPKCKTSTLANNMEAEAHFPALQVVNLRELNKKNFGCDTNRKFTHLHENRIWIGLRGQLGTTILRFATESLCVGNADQSATLRLLLCGAIGRGLRIRPGVGMRLRKDMTQ